MKAAPRPLEVETHQLKLRGLSTAWLQVGPARGKAPILCFLHGYPDSPVTWDSQLEAFGDSFLCIAPFARGVGPSEPGPRDRYRLGATSLDVLSILDQVDPKGRRDVVLVSHDLGVVAAWHLAPLLGPRLKGLVMMNGLSLGQMWGRRRRAGQHLRSWYIYAMQVPGLAPWLTGWFPRQCRNLAFALGGLSRERRPEPWSAEEVRATEVYRALVRDLAAGETAVPRLKAPLLVLWGDRDRVLLPPTWEELAPYSEAPTIRLWDAGHWPHRELPDKANAALGEFFGRCFEQRPRRSP